MDLARLRRRAARALAPAAVLVLLLAALYLAADAEGLGPGFARWYPYVFVAAALALLGLALAIGNRLLKLRRQLRERVPGARLARRLVLVLVLLALPPVVLVYGFGVRFVAATVDSWFDLNGRVVLEDALSIARLYLDRRLDDARVATGRIAASLPDAADAGEALDAALGDSGADQLALYSRDGRLLALAAARPAAARASAPDETLRLTALARDHAAVAEPDGEGMRLRVLVAVGGVDQQLLQALYPLPGDYARLARSVEAGVHDYGRAEFLRESLKLVFVLVLSFVLLLSVLLALLLAFDLARRLVAPIGRLAEATRDVAAGRYDQPLPVVGDDELAFLGASFNRMTAELAAASARERESAEATERQRAWLETLLARLSSGVFAIDRDGVLRTTNPAADLLLGGAVRAIVDRPLAALATELPDTAPLVDALTRRLGEGAREWREEVALANEGERRLLMLRGARLPDGGLLAVFDDSTGIDRARRDAAWSEVARRLAHEIKNPLTPIQLAAERLRRRILPRLDSEDAAVVDRATHTIVGQVEALKTLVDAFSEYARPPALKRRPIELAALAGEVLDLYGGSGEASIIRRFDEGLPRITADPDRLRQVLHNLIRNAIEAAGGPVAVTVSIARVDEGGRAMLELAVADDGPGLPPDFDDSWFEPYRTTKARGTGLGLAIVRKIAEEHGGRLLAGPGEGGGARFALRLPLDGA